MVILGLLLTIFLGWILVKIIKSESTLINTFALSYLIGIGLQTLLMFYISLLGIKLTMFSVGGVTLGVSVLLLIIFVLINRNLPGLPKSLKTLIELKQNFLRLNSYEKIAVLIILLLSIYAIVIGLYWPVNGWDALALYDFRAKVFASTGFMDDAIARGYFFGYPLFTSMAHTWIYLLGWNYPQFIYSFMYISFGILFYDLVRTFSTRLTSLIFTILVLISPPVFSNAAFAYTNLPHMVYFCLGSLYLFIWIVKNNYKWLILSALFMGLSTWVRSTEPFWLINIGVIIVASIYKKQYFALLYYSLLFFPIQQSWNIFQSQMAPHAGTIAQATQSWSVIKNGVDFTRLFMIIDFIRLNIISILAPYLLLMLISIALPLKKIPEWRFLLLIVFGNIFLLIFGAYIFTFIWEGWSLIGESLQRMIIVYIPLFLYVAAIRIDLEKIMKMIGIK